MSQDRLISKVITLILGIQEPFSSRWPLMAMAIHPITQINIMVLVPWAVKGFFSNKYRLRQNPVEAITLILFPMGMGTCKGIKIQIKVMGGTPHMNDLEGIIRTSNSCK